MADLDIVDVSGASLSLTALVNYTAQHSIPAVVNSVGNIFAGRYGLAPISVVSQPFTYTSFQEGGLCISTRTGTAYYSLPLIY